QIGPSEKVKVESVPTKTSKQVELPQTFSESSPKPPESNLSSETKSEESKKETVSQPISSTTTPSSSSPQTPISDKNKIVKEYFTKMSQEISRSKEKQKKISLVSKIILAVVISLILISLMVIAYLFLTTGS
ncbi:MAG: hypothetical protein GTN40_00260, partial [Candidatus Aenigmarchaeota archaeon]|nr:hypothetical protein [Candidatus Aenigmarchaeota archaeon]